MKKTNTARRYRISTGIAHRDIEGQTLLLVPDDPDLLTLNDTGRFIWQRVARRQSVDTIARAFQRAFHVSGETAIGDVTAFLTMLERRRIVRRG